MEQLLIIGHNWPEPGSSAAGSRMLQLIKSFITNDYQVSFACVATETPFSVDLNLMGVNCFNIELNNVSFDGFIKELNPDLVMFDRFLSEEQFGWRVSLHCPDALRILDTEDLHGLRAARHLAHKQKRSFKNADLFNDTTKREIASVFRCDVSLIISEYEIQLLQDFFKVSSELLHYVPFMAEAPSAFDVTGLASFSERRDFISIGNFLHAPNMDAVLYLKQEIWPMIRKSLPNVDLLIYGAYTNERVNHLNDPANGFLIKGRAEDAVSELAKARVCLAPLRFGAGLKGKLFDAMQVGTPSVTTSIGAEAMAGDLKWGGLIADSADTIVSSALSLYKNEALWNMAQIAGTKIINTRFSAGEHQAGLIQKIKGVKSKLDQHRMNNFTGAMLMHHSLQSTKFMSLWIEAKNKVKQFD
jgi:O-antigen biosynthesis protein